MKVIHILSHSHHKWALSTRDPEEINRTAPMKYISLTEPPYWVGFFKGDFHVIVAQWILSRTSEYQIECWRPYLGIKKPYSMEVDGVLHRVFPSWQYRIPKFTSGEYCPSLIKELKKEISNNKVLLHFHDNHSDLITSAILSMPQNKVPIIYQHRGGWFATFDTTINPYKFYRFRKQYAALKKISFYLSGSLIEEEIMKKKWGMRNVTYFHDGVDYNTYIPADKNELRKKYNIPANKKVIMYVGRFYSLKGVDKILQSYHALKNTYDLQLIMIGGYKGDEFYDQITKTGSIIITRIPIEELIPYLQLSDVYAMLVKEDLAIKFGGFGSAPIEALACNIPIISYNFIHFPGTPDEMRGLGMIPKNDKDIDDCFRTVFDNPQKFNNCREISIKYFNSNTNINSIIEKYKELFSKYYPAKSI